MENLFLEEDGRGVEVYPLEVRVDLSVCRLPLARAILANKNARTMKYPLSLVPLIATLLASGAAAVEPSKALPDLLGVWSGGFTMMTPEGASTGTTYYEFVQQTGNLLKGENRWKVQAGPEEPDSGPLPQGINSFLGVIADDGTIFLVVDGDTAIRRLRLTSDDTIDFVEFAGGERAVVVSVKLFREGSKGSVGGASGASENEGTQEAPGKPRAR